MMTMNNSDKIKEINETMGTEAEIGEDGIVRFTKRQVVVVNVSQQMIDECDPADVIPHIEYALKAKATFAKKLRDQLVVKRPAK
jgi:hypothetical protein